MTDDLSISAALKKARRVYFYLECANGTQVCFRGTKRQVYKIDPGKPLREVISNEGADAEDGFGPAASWTLKDEVLYIHFNT